MGNRVFLELRGSNLPYLAEEDEEALARLSSNNGLPLFWMALLQPGDLAGNWEGEMRAALADGDGETPIEPVCLSWTAARRNLGLTLGRAPARTPALAPLLQDWAAGLDTLASRGPAQEVQLDLEENANFYGGADEFLGELRRAVAVWHGGEPMDLPPIGDAAQDLTGYDDRTDLPFPRTMPEWQPGRAAFAVAAPTAADTAGEWLMVALGVTLVGASMLLGPALFGGAGGTVGLVPGFAAFGILVWRWIRWLDRRQGRRSRPPT